MAYIALKPCRFAGQSFRVGAIVPAEIVQPGASKSLVRMGIIAAEGDVETLTPQEGEATIAITIHANEGDMPLDVTGEGIQSVFDVLTSNAKTAETIIDGMTDGDALILLHVSDSRKSIKELAENRAKALSEAAAAAESDETPEEDQTPAEGEKPAQEGGESEGEE